MLAASKLPGEPSGLKAVAKTLSSLILKPANKSDFKSKYLRERFNDQLADQYSLQFAKFDY